MNPLYIKLGVAAAIGFAVVLLYRHTQTAAATIPADQGLPATPVSGDASSGGAAGDTGGLPLPYLPGFTGGSIQGQQADYAGYTATVGEPISGGGGVNVGAGLNLPPGYSFGGPTGVLTPSGAPITNYLQEPSLGGPYVTGYGAGLSPSSAPPATVVTAGHSVAA